MERKKSEISNKQYYDISDFHPKDTLFRISKGLYELGDDFGYVNQRGDTVIPFGKFSHSFTDTIITFGIVVDTISDKGNLIAINQQGKRLFNVYWIDNGPDYISEGLFRILRNGKIGFADTIGKIIIEPQYQCAYPFSDGKAQVTYSCELLPEDNEHKKMESETWFYIDRSGKKVK